MTVNQESQKVFCIVLINYTVNDDPSLFFMYNHSSFSNSRTIGYGFCEYQDQETALSAMRNLNTRELHGRNLRVDHATRDHGIDPKDLQASVLVQNYYFLFELSTEEFK